MALLWMDSFDHYLTADLTEKYAQNSGSTIVTTTGRRSSGAFVFSTNDNTLSKILPVSGGTGIVGFAIKLGASLPTGNMVIWTFRSGTTVQVTLAVDTLGFLRVYRGQPATNLLGTSSSALTTATYYYIELKVAIHASTGTVDVKLNGASVLSLSSQNTSASGAAVWDNFIIGNTNLVGGATLDDLYVLDGSGSSPNQDFLGDVRVDARIPTAEGNSSSWTPLSGTDNALMVDEVTPDDDTTYNSTATVNHVDTHVTQNAPVAGATIYGVQVCLSAKKSDAGAGALAPVIRHSSTDYVGTAVNIGTGYGYVTQVYGQNPGTSAAWTETDFNNAEFGYKRTA